MRSAIHLILFISLPFYLFSQLTPLPLNFKSYAIRLSVAKDESLVLVTRAGEVGLANSITSGWRKSSPDNSDEILSGKTLDNANFFNKDTGFVSGFINGKNWKYNILYHTSNGGTNWKAINFGQDGWVDDAINLDNGEAWLSVSGSGIAYSKDYGFTWEKFEIPTVKQRFTSIFFNTNHEGIIGSLWNSLAYTIDNCTSWKILPTPLDQKQYNKTNKDSRPELNRVAIFGDYFLVQQEGLVFFSKKDTVEWKWLKDYNDFYTDPTNSALFFKTTKSNFVRVDYSLHPIYTYENIISGYDCKCRNGSLFIASTSNIQQLNINNKVISVPFATNQSSKIEPIVIGYSLKGTIGVLDNKIYSQKEYNGKWDSLFNFPFSLDQGFLLMTDNDLILYNRKDDSLFYFDLTGKLVGKKSKVRMIEEFCKIGISELIFTEGSQGCFHGYSDQLIYSYENGDFKNPIEKSSGTQHKELLTDNNEEISSKDVYDFVAKIPALFSPSSFASINDLAFTEKEYAECKNDILDFKASIEATKTKKETKFQFPRNNLDFDRLINLVDSIKYLDDQRLNHSLLNLSNLWSTTTLWKKLELINYNNETLTIISRYYEPNAFYFPWIITINGYSTVTTSIEVNKFLEKVYPAFLSNKDRVAVLHKIIKDLY